MSNIVDSLSDYIRAGFDPHNQLKEARSEIERLRADVESLNAEADRWMRDWKAAVVERQMWQVKAKSEQAYNARLREALEKITKGETAFANATVRKIIAIARAALAEQGEK